MDLSIPNNIETILRRRKKVHAVILCMEGWNYWWSGSPCLTRSLYDRLGGEKDLVSWSLLSFVLVLPSSFIVTQLYSRYTFTLKIMEIPNFQGDPTKMGGNSLTVRYIAVGGRHFWLFFYICRRLNIYYIHTLYLCITYTTSMYTYNYIHI